MNRRQERQTGLCKGVLRHAWYPSSGNRTPKREGDAYIYNRCERCDRDRWLLGRP